MSTGSEAGETLHSNRGPEIRPRIPGGVCICNAVSPGGYEASLQVGVDPLIDGSDDGLAILAHQAHGVSALGRDLANRDAKLIAPDK